MKDLSNVTFVTVVNDPEALILCMLAKAAGMTVIESAQPHGASLDEEPDIIARVRAAENLEVWTMEIPGPKTEARLRKLGYTVRIIDHHMYGKLDRAHAEETGKRKRSSLEQFLEWTEITDEDLIKWNFIPDLVIGIGIMDDRYVQGLRKANYSDLAVEQILAYRAKLEQQINPYYAEIVIAAVVAWRERREFHDFTVFEANLIIRVDDNDIHAIVSTEISTLAIRYGKESHPSVISDRGGRQLYVNNIPQATIHRLEHAFGDYYTFTYGAGRCWGINNDKSSLPPVTLDEILAALAPPH